MVGGEVKGGDESMENGRGEKKRNWRGKGGGKEEVGDRSMDMGKGEGGELVRGEKGEKGKEWCERMKVKGEGEEFGD